jgi:hypothetical protein
MSTDATPATVNAEATTEPAAATTGSRWRGVASGICGVLAVVCLTLALIGIWANATVFDSDKVSDIVAVALDDPAVTSGLATWVTDEVFTAVDVESVVSELLPTRLDRFAPTLVGGAQTFVDQGLDRALSNPDVQELLTRAVERAHGALMRLLQGDGLIDGITVDQGAVTVNLLPLIGRGLSLVQGLGLFDDLEVPELTRSGDPSEQIADLEQATGRDLPDDFGQLTVFESDKLAEAQASVQNAQRLFALFRRATVLLAILAVVFLAASVLLSRNRWHAALLLALGATVGMILSRAVVNRVLDDAPDLVTGPSGQAAIADILGEATRGLLRLTGLIAILATVVVVWALFQRGWQRSDLVLVGSVALGLATVALLGITIESLLLGVALAVAAYLLVPRALASRRRVAAATP